MSTADCLAIVNEPFSILPDNSGVTFPPPATRTNPTEEPKTLTRLVMRGADGRLRQLAEDEKKNVVFHDKDKSPPKEHFRGLSPDEEKQFRRWAHENFKPNVEPDPLWHPCVRDEWARLRARAGNQGRA